AAIKVLGTVADVGSNDSMIDGSVRYRGRYTRRNRRLAFLACENLTGAVRLPIRDSDRADCPLVRIPRYLSRTRCAVANGPSLPTAHVHIPARTADLPITAAAVTDEHVRRCGWCFIRPAVGRAAAGWTRWHPIGGHANSP